MAKAKAYYYAGMYEEALSFFRQSLIPFQTIDNYVIFEWIGDTLNKLNRFDEAIDAYLEAIDIINKDYERTVNFFESERWDSPSDSYLNERLNEKNERVSNVEERIAYSKKLKKKSTKSSGNDFNNQKELLTRIGKENLITITGTFFYNNPEFEKGMILQLIKEKDNEFDSNAIAVYLTVLK